MTWFGVASYGIAALAYVAMTAVLLVGRSAGGRSGWINIAFAVSAVWAAVLALAVLGRGAPLLGLVAVDALHLFVWTACIASWLPQGAARGPSRRWLLIASGGAWLAALLAASSIASASRAHAAAYTALLVMALIGLLIVEQVFRNAGAAQRSRLRLLCVAIAGIFVTDLFVYSQAALLGSIVPSVWHARGLVSAALAPLILLALKRQSEWERELFVSRQVVFYTASLLGVGGYLLIMSLVAYVLRAVGGEWGLLLQLVFLFTALALLVVLFFAGNISARLKVFLVKHFYRNKYDYRHEWLRLTESLGRAGEPKALADHALRAIARIVGSDRGALWIFKDGGYERVAAFGEPLEAAATYARSDSIPAFLEGRDWVIDSQQYADAPGHYGEAFGAPEQGVVPPDSLVVPLDCQGSLQGFVALGKPAPMGELNFEDHDILKTAGRQVAIVLAQAEAQQQLTETRQFEAITKLSTYLMHDLKNLITQQELVVRNAERFRDRPGFFDDAIGTVRSGVERMRKVLDQLQGAARMHPTDSRSDVSRVLTDVRAQCSDRQPVPDIAPLEVPVWAAMDADKLTSCLIHLIRNAQDATSADGRISVEIDQDAERVAVTITDTGCGMDDEFVRERLFRPFDSTKGAKGMGIGAYQVRDAVRSVGGDVAVTSTVGSGTVFRLSIPRAGAPVHAQRVGGSAA